MSAASVENLVSDSNVPDQAAIEAWLIDYLSRLLKLEARELYTDALFDAFGLDSAATMGLTGDLSSWLGIEIDPAAPYDYPTISELSSYLAQEVAKGR
jgi:acyl carrier protein